MRIHTDTVTELHIRAALRAATDASNGVRSVDVTRLQRHGSRTHSHAWDVILTGSNPRRQNGGPDYAATYDEWGWFLAYLYGIDSELRTAGWPGYNGADDF